MLSKEYCGLTKYQKLYWTLYMLIITKNPVMTYSFHFKYEGS